jgi:hypothetical protein
MAKRTEWKRISNKIKTYKQVVKLTCDLMEAHKHVAALEYAQVNKSSLNAFLEQL